MSYHILTPELMAYADKTTREKYFLSSPVLMERAALGALDILLENYDLDRVLVVCGIGNNGGDGFAVARLLFERGINVSALFLGKASKATAECINQKDAFEAIGGTVLTGDVSYSEYTTIVDAIFGISLNRPIEGEFKTAVEGINSSNARVLSIDMPSGIHAGSGRMLGCGVMADETVTFGYKKVGQLLYPGASYVGRLHLVNIGIPPKIIDEMSQAKGAIAQTANYYELEENEICLPPRPDYSNKGTFGKLLLIAGSDEICGAAVLAGLAAMRCGIGMLRIVTHEKNRSSITAVLPEAMISCYEDEIKEEMLTEALRWCDCIAIGPGIGRKKAARQLVDFAISQDEVPVVLDADALNILAENMEKLNSHASSDIIITPHLGEMSRLTGISVSDISEHLIETAEDMAKNYNLICVLKDARTIIANQSGDVYINTAGNSGMATAGSGDVLTGIIAALVCRRVRPFAAAALGCALHGRSGDKAAGILSRDEILARDIIKYLTDQER